MQHNNGNVIFLISTHLFFRRLLYLVVIMSWVLLYNNGRFLRKVYFLFFNLYVYGKALFAISTISIFRTRWRYIFQYLF